ncbi:MAG: methyltransferase family protein [Promethearchaeota archaeon]
MGESKEQSSRDRLIIVIAPNIIFFVTLSISILIVIQFSIPWLLFPEMNVLHLPRLIELTFGLIFVILCVGLEAWGVASIGISRAQGAEIGMPESSIVTTGAYAYSRHPVTLGFAFGIPGFALVFDLMPLLINAILFIPIMIGLLFYEERELVNRLGEEYERYKEEVPMLIPKRRKD